MALNMQVFAETRSKPITSNGYAIASSIGSARIDVCTVADVHRWNTRPRAPRFRLGIYPSMRARRLQGKNSVTHGSATHGLPDKSCTQKVVAGITTAALLPYNITTDVLYSAIAYTSTG